MESLLRIILLGLFAVLLGFLDTAAAAQLSYCSSLNTGSDSDAVVSTFQSHGACHDTCNGRYAFAIVQGNSCWCSNAAPGPTSPRGDCNENCPGFPTEACGSTENGLFAYIPLGRRPSTTMSGPSPTTNSPSETTESPSTTLPATISVHTSNGQVVTVTVPITAPTTTVEGSGNGSSLSGGAIAGIVIGCGSALAATGLFLFWWCFYRRRQGSVKDDDYSSSFFERSVPRPMFQGTLGSRDAALAAASAEKGVNGYPPDSDPTRRLSVPAFTDSRLAPQVSLYPNGRGNSHVSLQDHQDYSRPVLRLTNPDP